MKNLIGTSTSSNILQAISGISIAFMIGFGLSQCCVSPNKEEKTVDINQPQNILPYKVSHLVNDEVWIIEWSEPDVFEELVKNSLIELFETNIQSVIDYNYNNIDTISLDHTVRTKIGILDVKAISYKYKNN